MYENKIIKLKIHGANIRHYESVLERKLTFGEEIYVTQTQLPTASRIKVMCKCDMCGVDFFRVRKDVKESTFCGKKCRNEHLKNNNPNPSIEGVKVNCEVCNKEFTVAPSKFKKQEHFLCSRDCYKIHRSNIYKGEKLYNYQNTIVECSNDNCNNEFKVTEFDIKRNNHHFCSQKCYWDFKSTHYKKFYYVPQLFEERKETIPESMVRKWLENNSIYYIQEYHILKYFVDFYIPDKKIIIEVYGDYWHCNPKIYGYGDDKKPLHENQIGKWEYDEKRKHEIECLGYEVYVVWESDVYDNLNHYMNNIFKISQKNP